LADAVIESAVALAFSQLLLAPEPLRLLRRAESTVLSSLAQGLELTADGIEHDDRHLAEQALADLRTLRDGLASLNTSRKASERIVRHSLTWRERAPLLVAERERADQLDLLAGSCLMLTRTGMAAEGASRGPLAVTVRSLAEAVGDLARDPGQVTRQVPRLAPPIWRSGWWSTTGACQRKLRSRPHVPRSGWSPLTS
jgi:hypothetical protein